MAQFEDESSRSTDITHLLPKQEAEIKYINATGDIMQGDLNMNSNKITNLADCPDHNDYDNYAVNKKYVDNKIIDIDTTLNNYLKIEGRTEKDMCDMALKKVIIKELSDILDVNHHKIINVGDCENDNDAVNKKYCDSMFASSALITVIKSPKSFVLQHFVTSKKILKVRKRLDNYPVITKVSNLIITIGVNNKFYNDITPSRTNYQAMQELEFFARLDKAEFDDPYESDANHKPLWLYFSLKNNKSMTSRVALSCSVELTDSIINHNSEIFHENQWINPNTATATFRSSDSDELDKPHVFYLPPLSFSETTDEERVELDADTYQKVF